MTKTFKKHIWILVVFVVIGGIIVFWHKKTEMTKV